MEYLPFTRPTLDEETILGVAEVLRSGWLTSGPKVIEFETALSQYLRRTSGAGTHLGHRRARDRAARRRCRPRRRSHHAGDELRRFGERRPARRRASRLRRRRPRHAQHRCRRGGGSHLPAHARDHAGALRRAWLPMSIGCTRLAKRHGLRVIEDAAHAIGTAQPRSPDRQFRRPGLLQLSREQEPDDDRGRRDRRRQRRGTASPSSVIAFTACRSAGRTSSR